jgi:hypothetical protein
VKVLALGLIQCAIYLPSTASVGKSAEWHQKALILSQKIQRELGGKPVTTAPTAPKRATIGFALSLIAAILILLNGIAFIALQSVLNSLIEFIPMPVTIPGIGFAQSVFATIGAIGVVFAILVLIGAFLIYMPGKEVIGGIIVLIFSILSIVTMGGFFIGMILGIIGGALGIAKK